MQFKTLNDFDLKGKTVLLRAGLNVPVQDGAVSDFTRIDRAKPTVEQLVASGARVLILSHFGRPKGQVVPELSMAFLAPVLSARWGIKVDFAENCIGEAVQRAKDKMQDGDVVLLENVRFHAEESVNDPDFAAALAAQGDIYINDAFSDAHRRHASTTGIAAYLPSGAGALMAAELNALSAVLEKPARPVAALVGGSKISTKLSLLHHMVEKMDFLVLGGGMANTFLFAQGANLGASLCETEMRGEALDIINKAKETGCEIILPIDCAVTEKLEQGASMDISPAENIPEGLSAVDIGPESIARTKEILARCHTVLWNGPMGVFEIPPFDTGTNALAQEVAALTQAQKCMSVAGGGDTVAALEQAGAADRFTYISTAGGAFLTWLEGKTLPGVAALQTAV